MRTRGRPPTISDDALLDAARDLFLERGLDATTAQIARRARISESVIFYRYKTKEALFIAVIERCAVLPPILEELQQRVGRGEVADHLYDVGAASLRLLETIQPLVMMAWTSSARMTLVHQRSREPHPVRVRAIRLLADYFAAEARLGRLRAVDFEILARAFFGAVCDFVMPQGLPTEQPPLDGPTFLRGVISLLLDGARAPRAAKKRRR